MRDPAPCRLSAAEAGALRGTRRGAGARWCTCAWAHACCTSCTQESLLAAPRRTWMSWSRGSSGSAMPRRSRPGCTSSSPRRWARSSGRRWERECVHVMTVLSAHTTASHVRPCPYRVAGAQAGGGQGLQRAAAGHLLRRGRGSESFCARGRPGARRSHRQVRLWQVLCCSAVSAVRCACRLTLAQNHNTRAGRPLHTCVSGRRTCSPLLAPRARRARTQWTRWQRRSWRRRQPAHQHPSNKRRCCQVSARRLTVPVASWL